MDDEKIYLFYLNFKGDCKNLKRQQKLSAVCSYLIHLPEGTSLLASVGSFQVVLAGTLKGVQGDIGCKVLAALSTVK